MNCVIRRPDYRISVMAGLTGSTYNIRAAVIDKPAGKVNRVVAGNAIRVGVLMNCVIRRPDYRISVMAGLTGSTDNIRAAVIDKRVGKVNRVVAGNAICVGVLMNCVIRRPSGV
jgi:hypothetical protein